MVAYFLLIVLVCVVSGVQVGSQALFRHGAGARESHIACDDGIRMLDDAIERARQAVHRSALAESEAVAAYRAALEPAWSRRHEVEAACAGDSQRRKAVRAVVALGFAEEHAVRRDATELASFRESVRKHLHRLGTARSDGHGDGVVDRPSPSIGPVDVPRK